MPDSSTPAPTPSTTLPVIEERVSLGRRLEETGAVRVRIRTEQHEQPLELASLHEQVECKRVPVGRVVEQRREPWHDGEVLVVPVYAEETVVTTRLVLVEELHLHTRRRTQHAPASVALRRQRAVIERRDADGGWTEVDATASPSPRPPGEPT